MGSWLDRAVILTALTACGGQVNGGASDASAGPPDCGASTVVCGNDCAVLSEDSRHCGSCGSDCGGGGCVNGACQSTVELASGGHRLAINSHDVVWTDGDPNGGGGVFKCAKWGCGGRPSAISQSSNGPDYLGALAATESHVYWSGATDLLACSLTGCCAPDVFGPPAAPREFIATDGRRVYAGAYNTIVACPVSGCTGDAGFASGWPGPVDALALGATDLFWAYVASGGPGIWIVSCPLAGCISDPLNKPLTIGAGFIAAMAVDATNVYWAEASSGSASQSNIQSCPLAGCTNGTPVLLASGQAHATSMATDGINVYWGDEGIRSDGGAPEPGAVKRCAVGGCGGTPTVAAESPGGAISVAVDDKSIYWIKLPEGTGKPSVMKSAK